MRRGIARNWSTGPAAGAGATPGGGPGRKGHAAKAGTGCGACHLAPSGGGELTAEGEAFRRERAAAGQPVAEPSRWRHTVRFVAGFLPLFIAGLVFGTLLYVPLPLKP